MQKVLQDLLDLQTVDVRLSGVRARLATLPKKLAEIEARIAAAKTEVEKSKAAQHATIRDRKKYELDVEQWKEKVGKYKDQMYQVKTNEAYKALQHEVQTGEQEIANAEDRLLEQMVSAEEYDRRVKSSERTVREVEEAMRAERLKVEAEKTAVETELAELNTVRARATADIPEDLRDHYERIAKKHNGIALAETRDEKCSACGMRVRPHVFQEMRRSDNNEIFHCETCTRILYYVEPVASAATASPGAPAAPQGDAVPNET